MRGGQESGAARSREPCRNEGAAGGSWGGVRRGERGGCALGVRAGGARGCGVCACGWHAGVPDLALGCADAVESV